MYEPEFETDNDFAQAPPDFRDLKHRVNAAMRSITLLGAPVAVNAAEQANARMVFQDPDLAPKLTHNAGVVVHLKMLLSAYDHQVVASAADLRNYVTNRLIEESDHEDVKVRLKALELIGKIEEVGLFSDRKQVTITQKPTSEITQMLKEKLAKVINVDPTAAADTAQTEVTFRNE